LEITIKGKPEEIAALVVGLQGRLHKKVDELPFNVSEKDHLADLKPPHSKHSESA
jgi:hypothetical protein